MHKISRMVNVVTAERISIFMNARLEANPNNK